METSSEIKQEFKLLSNELTHDCFGSNIRKYTITFEKSDNGKYDITTGFQLSGVITGCGLGAFSGWCCSYQAIKQPERTKFFVEILKREAINLKLHCLIATLGDNYKDVERKDWIEARGFKEVHTFINLYHNNNHKQRIYICDTKDLK